jgi:hypothetical protein
MKKFKSLWYTGLAIVGIPVALVLVATFFTVTSRIKNVNHPIEEIEQEQPKTDTVIIEKRVIVRDTVYIKPKIKTTPITPVNDSL